MSTLTIAVSEQTLARLRAKAEAHGTTPEAVAAAELDRPARKSDTDPLMRLAGMFQSDLPGVFERHDEYIGQALYDEMHRKEDGSDVR